MLFTRYLRDGVRSGAITCSVRVWHRPRVSAGKRYRMEEGEIEVDSIEPITFDDVTPALARACGFASVADLLKIAKHGSGENVYLVLFHYVSRNAAVSAAGAAASRRRTGRARDARSPAGEDAGATPARGRTSR